MKKELLLLICIFSINTIILGQGGVRIGETEGNPHSSAGLEVDFGSKGLLPPRMTSEQRDLIADPSPGLRIYNTDTGCENYFNGIAGAWNELCGTCIPPKPGTPGVITGTSPQIPNVTDQVYSIGAVAGAVTYNWAVPSGWNITDGQGTTSIVVTTGDTGEGGNLSVTAENICGQSNPSSLNIQVFTPPCAGVNDYGYGSIAIGDQCWMAKNYNGGTMVSGGNSQGTNCGSIQKYCYDNQSSNCDTYGGLYQWSQAMCGSTTPGAQGICPSGWHIPTDEQLTQLIDYLSSEPAYWCGANSSSIAKSLAATSGWTADGTICNVGNNQAANNASGFTSLQGGFRYNGSFYEKNNRDYWWTSSLNGPSNAYFRFIKHDDFVVPRSDASIAGAYGYSIRCLRD